MRRTRSSQFQSKQPTQLPIYQQLAEKIRFRILNAEFGDAGQLPSIRELTTMFDANYLTARHALKHLESEGLVSMQTGRSTFATAMEIRSLALEVITPDLRYKINAAISKGIRLASGVCGAVPVFMDFRNDPKLELECLRRLQDEKIEATLIYPSLQEQTKKTFLKLPAQPSGAPAGNSTGIERPASAHSAEPHLLYRFQLRDDQEHHQKIDGA